MKTILHLLFALILLNSCDKIAQPEDVSNIDNKTEGKSFSDLSEISVEGSWKLIYADIRENDSLIVKDLSQTDFIKIINKTHFAFFNQEKGSDENFMSGAGSYTFNGTDYIETLDFISITEYRGHEFPFKVEIIGDSLIQQGHEKIEEAGLDRYILEKYIRIESK